MNFLSREQIEKHLTTDILGRSQIEVWESIDSTNTRAASLAAEGAPEGLVAVARQQTAGRGRLGRVWMSPMDAGVYMSVLLRPQQIALSDIAPMTLACGVAVSRAVEKVAGVRLELKWVNDLVHNGRKLGGILAEMPSNPGNSRALVIGFGLNVRIEHCAVPDELVDKLDWLERLSGAEIDVNHLAAEVLFEVEKAYDHIKNKKIETLLAEWRIRSATLGKEVVATSGTQSITGRAVDIDETGALLVATKDGKTEIIHAGEVTIRTPEGKYI